MTLKPKHAIITKYSTPHKVNVMKQWCLGHFGQQWDPLYIRDMGPNGLWTCYWEGPQADYGTAHKWIFFKEEHASMFALQWS